jgi:hypothetical protein
MEDAARFRSRCGAADTGPKPLDDFEIGRIAALGSVKTDIPKWVGGSTAIFGTVIAVLGFFGVRESLNASMIEEVKVKVEEVRRAAEKDMGEFRRRVDGDVDRLRVRVERSRDEITRQIAAAEALQ